MATGMVFNIQHDSIHDGPGIRTLIFLKGCPLRCQWCCNPESQRQEPELALDPDRCLGVDVCGRCLKACPQGALIAHDMTGKIALPHRELCGECPQLCAAVCPPKALAVYGTLMDVDQVLDEAERDAVFYRHSGGGITLSGGEPLFQPAFTMALMEEAHRRGLGVCMETSGHAPWTIVERAAALADGIIFDLKQADPLLHRQGTGVDAKDIMDNVRRLVPLMKGRTLLLRSPVIQGYSDTEATIRFAAGLAENHAHVRYELLPYHSFGKGKYQRLGRPAPVFGSEATPERLENLRTLARQLFGERFIA